jgi:hypothetical protein
VQSAVRFVQDATCCSSSIVGNVSMPLSVEGFNGSVLHFSNLLMTLYNAYVSLSRLILPYPSLSNCGFDAVHRVTCCCSAVRAGPAAAAAAVETARTFNVYSGCF